MEEATVTLPPDDRRYPAPDTSLTVRTGENAGSAEWLPPAAGAHAADHLTNEEATPGSGALTSRPHLSGREVDGGAG